MFAKLWESKIFKILAGVLLILFLMVFFAALGVALKYYSVAKTDIPAELVSGPELQPGEPPFLGESVLIHAVFDAPWNKMPDMVSADAGTGTQLLALPEIVRSEYFWGSSRWLLTIRIQPYRTGETGEGKIRVAFGDGKNKAQTFELKIPSFRVQEREPPETDELLIAGRIDEIRTNTLLYVVLGCLTVLLILTIYLLIFRKRVQRAGMVVLTPWEAAIEAIFRLRRKVSDGNASPELSLAELTDIVRQYLERRFSLRAEHQTTHEFLTELEHNNSVLRDQDRQFLKSFLSSADLVKFAKLPADKTLFDNAALRAEKLIEETVPEPQKKENEK